MGDQPATVCLAVTCHDPAGAFVPGITAAGAAVTAVFESVAISSTTETSAATVQALATTFHDMEMREHGAGTIGIGAARRAALELALEAGTTHVAYSDLDHVLRWAASDPDELATTMTPATGADFVVIGRSPAAFAREPRRLQATEGPVNHVAALALGLDPGAGWDFMIATRLMTRAAARLLVEESREDSIANDVEWPLLLRRRARTLAHLGVDGLAYRFRDDFSSASDTRDDDPVEWVRRLEIAASHATAMRPYL
jgi:hypothetical protein